ncbi:invasion associated locus B family protein [Epibacterium sp. SM1969]|uniref:Invasion associated locus B family protein n=1 Tax=Tritonibacter aquimaris TaxID=2663379 RepID=A0A844AQZ7_9RHOB|nr:invasion associated locus B family protein [Tritonibacter aquimaris]MQY41478.1 invasion associated locus B family protein [Tritonibacter aquimaris]
MFKSLTPITFAVAMALTTSVAAQDAETQTPDATAGEAPAAQPEQQGQSEQGAGSNGPALDLGQEVQNGPRLGERYSKEKHGDWDLACVKTEAEQDPCSLLQIVLDSNGNPLAEISMFRIESANSPAVAGATVIVPLETLLTAGLTIAIDGAPAKRYGFSFCNSLGCVAQIGLTQEDIDAYKRGNAAVMSLRPAQAPDQVIDMNVSLSGFTAGYKVVDLVKQ